MDLNVLGDIVVDSPAQEAGLQKGDRVIAVNGEQVASWIEMTDALNATGKNDPVELELWRPNNQRDASSDLPWSENSETIPGLARTARL